MAGILTKGITLVTHQVLLQPIGERLILQSCIFLQPVILRLVAQRLLKLAQQQQAVPVALVAIQQSHLPEMLLMIQVHLLTIGTMYMLMLYG